MIEKLGLRIENSTALKMNQLPLKWTLKRVDGSVSCDTLCGRLVIMMEFKIDVHPPTDS